MFSRTMLRAGVMTGAMLLAGFATTGCATKKFVREQVATEDVHVTEVEGTAKDALGRANAAHKLAEGKFLYQVVLSDDSVKFPTDVHQLSPEAQSRLQELAERLKGENRNVYLEIQGHTDAKGTKDYNDKLGEERAEAVRRFLNEQGVSLEATGASGP